VSLSSLAEPPRTTEFLFGLPGHDGRSRRRLLAEWCALAESFFSPWAGLAFCKPLAAIPFPFLPLFYPVRTVVFGREAPGTPAEKMPPEGWGGQEEDRSHNPATKGNPFCFPSYPMYSLYCLQFLCLKQPY